METNKLKHISSILCEKVIIDQQTNNISVIGIMSSFKIATEMNLKELKENGYLFPIQSYVISIWHKESTEEFNGKGIANIIDPTGKKLLEASIDFNIPGNSKSHTTIMKLEGLPLTEQGTYKIEIGLENNGKVEVQSTYYLEVEFEKNPLIHFKK